MSGLSEMLQSLIRGNSRRLNSYLLDVCTDYQIDSTNSKMHLYMVRMDGNNRPRINDLCEFLLAHIVDYCIPPSEIAKAKEEDQKYNTTANVVRLQRKAEKLFSDIKNTGEGGELLLSIISQSFLNLPQLLCKMSLKTNPRMHVHGADGLFGKYDETNGKFALYWGESKLYADIASAIRECFDSIKELLTPEGAIGTYRDRDLSLFRENIDFDNPELEEMIVQFLDPDSEEYLRIEYRGVCLVGFDEASYPSDMSKVEEEVKLQIQEKIAEFAGSVGKKIQKESPLDKIEMIVILLPFPSVQTFRDTFLEGF